MVSVAHFKKNTLPEEALRPFLSKGHFFSLICDVCVQVCASVVSIFAVREE